jgi:hypothetical protein
VFSDREIEGAAIAFAHTDYASVFDGCDDERVFVTICRSNHCHNAIEFYFDRFNAGGPCWTKGVVVDRRQLVGFRMTAATGELIIKGVKEMPWYETGLFRHDCPECLDLDELRGEV